MREKFGNKVIITLALAALLSELLNVSNEIYGAMPVLRVVAMIASIALIGWLWWYWVIVKDRRAKEAKEHATQRLINTVEFESIYKELCDKHKDALEKKRIIPKKRLVFRYAALAALGGSIGLSLFCLLGGNLDGAGNFVQIMFIAVVVLMTLAWTSDSTTFEYKAEYKARIAGSLIKHINPQLEYTAVVDDEQQVLSEYEEANFGLLEQNEYECLDRIYGNVENNYIEMAGLNLDNRMIMEDGKEKTLNIFKGYFGVLPLDVNTEFKLKLSAVGVKTRAEIYEYKTRKIKLDSTKFMDSFVVQTNDKMIATRILTSEVMSELVDYKNKFGITLDISIKNGKIYFLFYTGDMFEPDIMKDSMNKKLILKDYATMKMLVELTQKIGTIVKEV